MAERQLLSFQAFCPVIFLQPIFSSLFYNPLMSCHVHTGSLSQRANMQYTMSQAELQVGSCVQVCMHTHVLVCVVIAGASLANCIKIIIHPKVVTISNWNSIQNGGKCTFDISVEPLNCTPELILWSAPYILMWQFQPGLIKIRTPVHFLARLFTCLTAHFAAVSKKNFHWVALKHRFNTWTLAHFYYVHIGTYCCVFITLL